MIKVATGASKCGGAHAACFKPRRGTRRCFRHRFNRRRRRRVAGAAFSCVCDALNGHTSRSHGTPVVGIRILAYARYPIPKLKFAAISPTMCILFSVQRNRSSPPIPSANPRFLSPFLVLSPVLAPSRGFSFNTQTYVCVQNSSAGAIRAYCAFSSTLQDDTRLGRRHAASSDR